MVIWNVFLRTNYNFAQYYLDSIHEEVTPVTADRYFST